MPNNRGQGKELSTNEMNREQHGLFVMVELVVDTCVGSNVYFRGVVVKGE